MEVACAVGLTNGTWIAGGLGGVAVAWMIVRDDNFEVFKG